MARGFRRVSRGYRCRLDSHEATLLRRLAGQLQSLIVGGTQDAAEGAADPSAARPASPRPGSVDELEALATAPAEAPVPADPVLRRLFPDGYADAGDAAEFRRFTQADLAGEKIASLRVIQATLDDRGGDVTLDEDAAQSWLTGVNDLRLALGTIVGITEDNVDALAALPDDDPRAALFEVYDLLTYLQQTLIEAVAGW